MLRVCSAPLLYLVHSWNIRAQETLSAHEAEQLCDSIKAIPLKEIGSQRCAPCFASLCGMISITVSCKTSPFHAPIQVLTVRSWMRQHESIERLNIQVIQTVLDLIAPSSARSLTLRPT